jgi:hypothetical protein
MSTATHRSLEVAAMVAAAATIVTAVAHGGQAASTSDVVGRAVARATGGVAPVRPDDRAGTRGSRAAAPAVFSSTRPDDRAGARGPGENAADRPATVARPDDRAGARGPGSARSARSTAARPDDRAGGRGPGWAVASSVSPADEHADGFNWRAAVYLALGAVAVLAVAVLSIPLIRQRRRVAVS